ncbi:MAG: CBS domain-containing protein [Alphaproteobacteria bacterium]|nr:CBS domain-containing protein [Alphaproteobacteria bacterium]
MYASELMDDQFETVSSHDTVARAARLLYEHDLDGVCVVDDGKLVGVVTAMDVIFQEKHVEVPHYVNLLNRVLPIERKLQADLDKATGTTVSDIMTPEAVGVAYDATLADVASLMVEKHITVVPVLKDGRLAGVIDKKQVLREALMHLWKQQEG